MVDNIERNRNPGVVDSRSITQETHLAPPEVIGLLKMMNEAGMIVSSLDTRHSIVTRKGVAFLDDHR